jgi:hypothetical protein
MRPRFRGSSFSSGAALFLAFLARSFSRHFSQVFFSFSPGGVGGKGFLHLDVEQIRVSTGTAGSESMTRRGQRAKN